MEKCFYRVSVKAIIMNDISEILLCKELNWFWDLPWWWLDHFENPIDCLKRELKEEMWLEVLEINKNPRYFITAHKPESKTRPFIANICYEVKVKNLNFTKSDECVEIWFFNNKTVKDIKVLPNVEELFNNL